MGEIVLTALSDAFNEYRRLEKRLRRIERMDKDNLSLDEQCALVDEYTRVWNRINQLNK